MKRTLLITGASRGIGAHLALKAQEAGYAVIGLARTANPDAPYPMVACDLRDMEQLKQTFQALKKDTTIYGLVHAAGVAAMNLTIAMPDTQIRDILDTNLLGTIRVNQLMGKMLARRKAGRIINFSSIAVPLSLKGEAVYVASKAGVEGFTKSFAREMADFKVTVNTIAPGPIETDLIKGVPQHAIDDLISRQIQPEQADKADVWNQVSLLLDERADRITGEVIHIGGA